MFKKRSLVGLFITMVITVLVCSCEAGSNSNTGQSSETELLLDENSFSEYYEKSEGFQIIKPDVISLFNLVRTAYDQSDKESMSSFSIDFEKCFTLYDKITDVIDNYDRSKNDNATMLKAAVNVAKINKSIAEINILYAAAGGEGKSPQTFDELKQTLEAVHQDFTQSESIPQKSSVSPEIGKAIESGEELDPIVGKWELVHMEEMGTLPVNMAANLEASGISIPEFECDSELFCFSFSDANILDVGKWKEVDPNTIGSVSREILKAYELDESKELAAYFDKTDHKDYKYLYLKARIQGILYEMRFRRAE